jgi:ABC-type multidrug transport system fused ATPase/permease subunit
MQKRQQEQSQSAEKIQLLETGKIVIPPGPRLGERVISVHGIKKSFEGRVLFEKLSFELVSAALHSDTFSNNLLNRFVCRAALQEPGAIVGVIGANGCGKSTLFNILAGHAVSYVFVWTPSSAPCSLTDCSRRTARHARNRTRGGWRWGPR